MQVNKLFSFQKDERGTVAMVFGATLALVVAVVGGAVDFGRALSISSELQGMLDASVAAGLRHYGDTDNASAAEDYTKNFFDKLTRDNNLGPGLNKAGTGQPQITASVNPATLEMNGTVTVDVLSPFLSLAGIDKIPVTVESTAGMQGKKLELSLMLDVTGSMSWYSGGTRKLDSLKDAAHDLLSIFSVNMAADATRVALVPFSETVYVGKKMAPLVRGNQPKRYKFRRRNSSKNYKWKLTNCVTERTGADAYTNRAPGNGSWVGANYTSNGKCKPNNEIVPLTNDKDRLDGIISGLSATGGTAGHIGTAGPGTCSPTTGAICTPPKAGRNRRTRKSLSRPPS